MDTDTKKEFATIVTVFEKESKKTQKQFDSVNKQLLAHSEQFERLAIMVAEGFSDVHKRIDFVYSSLKSEITEMRIEFKADIA